MSPSNTVASCGFAGLVTARYAPALSAVGCCSWALHVPKTAAQASCKAVQTRVISADTHTDGRASLSLSWDSIIVTFVSFLALKRSQPSRLHLTGWEISVLNKEKGPRYNALIAH
jgi:hypothetical protein